MKNLFLALTICMLSCASIAQLKEGHVSFKIETSTDNPDMQMAVGMLQGSTMEVYFKEKFTRGEFKMGSMMTITNISNETSGDVLMLMSGMMGNNAIKMNAKDLEKDTADLKKPKVDVSITNETKVIEGYTCKKALVTDEEGTISTFWFTEDIYAAKKGQSYLSSDVPGFPMQFEMNNNGMKMMMTVTKVETKLASKSSDLFNMSVPEGYKEMTADQLKQMGMSGM
jgi:GLPGLI family protein